MMSLGLRPEPVQKAPLRRGVGIIVSVSQAPVVSVKPAATSPCSTVTKDREFTSPDPVPPLTVRRAPLP